jgi:hypothetical protein
MDLGIDAGSPHTGKRKGRLDTGIAYSVDIDQLISAGTAQS